MKNLLLGTVLAISVAPAAFATTYPIGTPGKFYITAAAPDLSTVAANFGTGFYCGSRGGCSSAINDSYTFTLPFDGLGSGSLSTSFSGPSTLLTITSVIINGMTTAVNSTSAGQVFTINNVPILANELNTIQILGSYKLPYKGSATYSGTATYEATTSAVPEPAAWAMMIGGLGLVGSVLRRRRNVSVSFA